MELLIAGDFCPDDRLERTDFTKGSIISPSVASVIRSVDYFMVNFECPVAMTDSEPLPKQGPNLRCSPKGIEVIKRVGINGLTLANNHFYDYGERGVERTLEVCKRSGIDTVGGGMSLDEASMTLFKEIEGENLAIINCCEHEFSIAKDEYAGANPLDPIIQFQQIKEAKKVASFIVVIVHGGVEHFQYPTARMVKTYRFFIDAGADVVINHHQHCPCGYEEYKGKPIFYGLGNFFFPWEGKVGSIWNLGYMVKLSFKENHKLKYEIIPYRQCDGNYEVILLIGEELQSFNKMITKLSEAIQDKKELTRELRGFNQKNNYLYKKMFEPYSGRLMNGLYRRGLVPSFMSKERILALIDFIGCESHYERVMDYLNETYKYYFDE